MTTDPRVEAAAIALAGGYAPEAHYYHSEAERVLAAADAVDPLRQTGHILELRESGYGLQHPPECRPNLLDCELDAYVCELGKAPELPGRYRADLIDGELQLERIENADDDTSAEVSAWCGVCGRPLRPGDLLCH